MNDNMLVVVLMMEEPQVLVGVSMIVMMIEIAMGYQAGSVHP